MSEESALNSTNIQENNRRIWELEKKIKELESHIVHLEEELLNKPEPEDIGAQRETDMDGWRDR